MKSNPRSKDELDRYGNVPTFRILSAWIFTNDDHHHDEDDNDDDDYDDNDEVPTLAYSV